MITENGLDLWLADVERASARKLSDYKINNTYYGSPLFWTRDSASIVAKTVPANRWSVPEESTIPTGPITQQNLRGATPARTYQDRLLKHQDETVSDYCFTSLLI